MNVNILLNFVSGSVDGKYYIKLFEEYVRFEPDLLLLKNQNKGWRQSKWNPNKHLKLIFGIDRFSNLIVSNHEGCGFSCNQTSSNNPHRVIRIRQPNLNLNLDQLDLSNIINKDGFVSAYIIDDDYEMVQSTKFANNLKGLNISADILSSIEKTPYRIEYSTGFKVYDITHNPGRGELIGYTWLNPAWKMWFGKGFYHLITKEKILKFPDAYEIKELTNDIVYVRLFEKIEESWTKENMKKQQTWREWLNFDGLTTQFQ